MKLIEDWIAYGTSGKKIVNKEKLSSLQRDEQETALCFWVLFVCLFVLAMLLGFWDLSSRPGVEPRPLLLKCRVLTSELPGILKTIGQVLIDKLGIYS